MKERVCIFIDGSNFYNALIRRADFNRTRVDYHRLSQLLCGRTRTLVRTYFYTASYKQEDNPDLYAKQQRFFDDLVKTPYLDLRLGRKVKRPVKFDKYMRQDFETLIDPLMDKLITEVGERFNFGPMSQEVRDDFNAFMSKLFDQRLLRSFVSIINKKSPKIVEKGVDVALTSEMIYLAHQDVYDTAILVSADGDYVQAAEIVKRIGKHVENAFFQEAPNTHLRNACDVFVPITKTLLDKSRYVRKS